jgi:hypothetical protein
MESIPTQKSRTGTVALNVLGAVSLPILLLIKAYFMLRYKSGQQYTERCVIKAIRKANKLHQATGYRYIVFMCRGKIIIKPKRLIKSMLAFKGKYFAPDTTMHDIEKRALYITH